MSQKNIQILLVDDDEQIRSSTEKVLRSEGYDVLLAANGKEGLEVFLSQPVHLILSDIRMPEMNGMEFLKQVRQKDRNLTFILMTAFGEVHQAVEAMKLGAYDFISKPFTKKALVELLERAVKLIPARQNISVGKSTIMKELWQSLDVLAPSSGTVLITGESGTGKEFIAREVHRRSQVSRGPWVAINCASISEGLLESELFGHEKGSFTGAEALRRGLIESAHGGTLFLDEVGEISPGTQAKLLRFLQEGEIRRVGGQETIKVRTRVIAATHRNLREMAAKNQFRWDLLYRLEVLPIHVPPLRERTEDIVDLAVSFLSTSCKRNDKVIRSIHEDALTLMLCYSWPGNIRELENVMERAVVLSHTEEILPEDLPSQMLDQGGFALAQKQGGFVTVPLGTSLKAVEDLLIKRTLEATQGNKEKTARMLGINSRTIYRKLREESSKEKDFSEEDSEFPLDEPAHPDKAGKEVLPNPDPTP